MNSRQRCKEMIAEYLELEFGSEMDDLSLIAIGYSTMWVGDTNYEEQWYASLEYPEIWLEVDGDVVLSHWFGSWEQMEEYLGSWDNLSFEALITEADNWIEEHVKGETK